MLEKLAEIKRAAMELVSAVESLELSENGGKAESEIEYIDETPQNIGAPPASSVKSKITPDDKISFVMRKFAGNGEGAGNNKKKMLAMMLNEAGRKRGA